MSDPSLEEEFKSAASFLRGIAGQMEPKDLLYFYARFKQANEGPNNSAKPGFFDFQGKQKWQAWKDLGDMPAEQAMKEYIAKLQEKDPEWGGKTPLEEKSWVSVSAMAPPEEEQIADQDKTLLDWVKEGNLREVQRCVREDSDLLSKVDAESSMAPLHWAADRGFADLVRVLIGEGADVNQIDGEGQTALHFAASCGHVDVVNELLKAEGIDASLCDNDGLRAADVCENEAVKNILNSKS